MLEPGGVISSSITLAVAAIGAGMLAFPLAFANLGLVAATASLGVIAFFTAVSFYYLALGIERLGLCSYEDLTRVLLGHRYEKAIRVMLVALNFGVAVCYVVVIGEMMVPLQPTLLTAVHETFGTGTVLGYVLGFFVSTPSRCLTLIWLLLMLPLSLSRSMSALRYTTALAICASVYIVCAVVFREVHPSADQGQCAIEFQLWNGLTDTAGNSALVTPAPSVRRRKLSHVIYPSNMVSNKVGGAVSTARLEEMSAARGGMATPTLTNVIYLFNIHPIMFLALPIICYSLDCQCFVFQLYCDLKPSIRSAKTMAKVAGLSMTLACLMYFLVGTFGYLSFGDRTRGNILQNYHPTEDWVMGLGYTLYSVPVVMAYALTIFPLRDAIFNYLYGVSAAEQQSVISSFTFYSWSACVSFATLVFGILTPGIVVIIGLLGAMCSSVLCFVLPAKYRIQMAAKGLLPYGVKGGDEGEGCSDAVEMMPGSAQQHQQNGNSSVAINSGDTMRQQSEVKKILQKEASATNLAGMSDASGAANSNTDTEATGALGANVEPANYGSIVEVAQSSSEAELTAIPITGRNISVPLSPFVDAALAHTMLWLGIISAVLGTTAATLNIAIGIGA